jgi:uncharacterized protein YndB with AHSA1/START domain
MAATNRDTFSLTLPSERELVMTRLFDAPRELLWKAHTDPSLIPQWWGSRAYVTIVDKMEVRPGGAWRFINRGQDGSEDAFRGEFLEIVEPDHITWTFEWEGMPGHVATETVTFEEQPGGKTRLTTRSVFQAPEDRDGMVQSGMEQGARETWDRLEELAATLRS